jgi:flavin reductase (DIM6/NTAB) family NADH-FMN oxidoreductase RutF
MSDKTSISLAEAMRRFATSVSIISAGDRDRRYAMTATAVASVSLNPESMLVCVNRNTLFSSVIADLDRFCVNVLTANQITQSRDCAGGLPQDNRVNDREWEILEDGMAILKGAQVSILCRKSRSFDYGTHVILIGDVYRILLNGINDPLLYMDGKYGKFEEIK